jgi:hypothetical protein
MLVPPSPSTSSGVVFHQVPSMCSNCVAEPGKFEITPSCQAENHRLKLLSALRAHTKVPHKTDLLWETLRPLNRPETGPDRVEKAAGAAEACGDGLLDHCPRRETPKRVAKSPAHPYKINKCRESIYCRER